MGLAEIKWFIQDTRREGETLSSSVLPKRHCAQSSRVDLGLTTSASALTEPGQAFGEDSLLLLTGQQVLYFHGLRFSQLLYVTFL